MATANVTGYELGKRLVEMGLIPRKTRRIVIDINVQEVVKVYYSTLADQSLIDALLDHLTEAKFIEVPEKPDLQD
jgi:hypothetical protein